MAQYILAHDIETSGDKATLYAKENKEQVRINEALSSRILMGKVF